MADMTLSSYKFWRTMDPDSRPSLNKCCSLENRLGNRIDALPDDVLISIISQLNLKEVARTSALSRRWRYLWTCTTGILDFVDSIPVCDAIHSKQNLVDPSRSRLIDWVNQVLNVHKGSSIDEFKICFGITDESSDVIIRWIKFALEKLTKRLFLDFRCSGPYAKFSFRTRVFDNCPLGSLTCLILKDVDMTDEVSMFILSSFPLLQVLHLNSVSSLASLTIADPSSSLKCLKIKKCWSLCCLEVHAVNLVSFTYHGPKVKKFFKEVPSLVKASTDKVFPIQGVDNCSSCFSQLESLRLDLRDWHPKSEWTFDRLLTFPKFQKLNYLEFSWSYDYVECYIRMCALLLEASPLLQRFVLKKYEILENLINLGTPTKRRVRYQHKHLKVIEFCEFGGHKPEVELALRLCEMLPGLETLVVETRPFPTFRQFEKTDFGIAAKRARLMQNLLPKGVELVID